jgi:nucleoside-diphosphate-sugar epimerase
MAVHVIVGAGPVGAATARVLASEGHTVRMVTRSGTGPTHAEVERVRADASDTAALRGIAEDAQAIYNCANPPYHRWTTDWPPLAASILGAAEATGAVLVTVSNLYGYGPVDHPMAETDELAATGAKGRVRAMMWRDALEAHRAGRVRVTELRSSDFFGPEVTGSSLGDRIVPALLARKGVRVLGDPDAPRSWTYVPDVARMLAVLATDERAWGHAWHTPSNPPLSQRAMVEALCRAAGVPPVSVGRVPGAMLSVGGLFSPLMKELREVLYQFDRPFVMDSSAATQTFGVTPTPLKESLAATIEWYRARAREAA